MFAFFCGCCGPRPLEPESDHLLSDISDEPNQPLTLPVFAAMWCRSSGSFALQKTLEQIGSRQRKVHCWVMRVGGDRPAAIGSSSRSSGLWDWLSSSSGSPLVLSVSTCAVGVHERHHLERALELSASHPLLLPILAVDLPRPDRLIVVREWCGGGSLRDIIHGVGPAQSVHAKYDRVGSPLSEGKCASLGRAILDALLVLRPLGARACLHVHCGNIFLVDEQPRIAEWEQGLLGLPSHLADFINDLKRALEPAAASLALCLYEMACGFEIDGLPAVFPPTCSRAVRETLDVMLRAPPPSQKRAARTLEDVLELPLFALPEATSAAYACSAASASATSAGGGALLAADWDGRPPPLSDALLKHVANVKSARGDPSSA